MSSGVAPRAKPRAASPRPARPVAVARPVAAARPLSAERRPSASPRPRTPKAPSSPSASALPVSSHISAVEGLNESQAKEALLALRSQHAALLLRLEQQDGELERATSRANGLQAELDAMRAGGGGSGGSGGSGDDDEDLRRRLHETVQELRASEAQCMSLQRRVAALEAEAVSEEEVDRLFYALELKEAALAEAQRAREGLEAEVQTARQLTARGGALEQKYVEVHHHANLSASDSDEESDGGGSATGSGSDDSGASEGVGANK